MLKKEEIKQLEKDIKMKQKIIKKEIDNFNNLSIAMSDEEFWHNFMIDELQVFYKHIGDVMEKKPHMIDVTDDETVGYRSYVYYNKMAYARSMMRRLNED